MARTPSLTTAALACAFATAGLAQSPAARVEMAPAAQPRIAASTTGRVWLAYGQPGEAAPPVADHAAHADGKKAKGHSPRGRAGELWVARSDNGGASFAPAIKVAALPKLALGLRRGPRLAVHEDRITVTAIGDELVSFSSTDSGATWGAAVTINEVAASAREGLHDLAGGPDGELFVTWLDLRHGAMELWGATSRDGGRSWARNELVYKSPDKSVCECCHPVALFDPEGNLAVMWRNSIEGARDMWMTTRARGAAGFGPARKIGEGTWKIAACPMDGGQILALGGGGFGAVYQRQGEVFLARGEGPELKLGAGKQPVAVQAGNATPTKLASEARFPSVVALPGGEGVLLAYERGPSRGPTSVVVERL